ncbi:hypothetical protein G9A89_020836 [Geosiphon pyriformis]|nr:hypothetical protein G9A89_020836 [Geosiphon pyriformis]
MAYTPIAKIEKFTGEENITQNYLSLLITPEDATFHNLKTKQKQPLTSNILPATITEDKLLTAIFPFELKEQVKCYYSFIKLILDCKSVDSIITKQLMDQLGHRVDYAANARIITANRATKMPIGEIDKFLFEINGLITPIKVLVIEATQYQALVGNDWLVKTNAMLD